MVEALVGRVEAGRHAGARQAAVVVGRVTVVEPVGQDEVEDLFRQVVAQRVKGQGLVRGIGRVVVPDVDGDIIAGRRVRERDRVTARDRERDIVRGIGRVPALADGDLDLVAAGGEARVRKV